jgi:hypothetical protein
LGLRIPRQTANGVLNLAAYITRCAFKPILIHGLSPID